VSPLAILLFVGAARAGQIEAPVSGQARPGAQTGAIGSTLGAPVPIQMSVPTLTGSGAPVLAPVLSPAPALVQPAALQASVVAAAAVPVLPNSAVTATPKALAGNVQPAPSSVETPADPGLILFDQARERAAGEPAEFVPPRAVVRRDAGRSTGWEVDGVAARRLAGGGFKDVLIHPADSSLVLKLFSQAGADDAAGSLSEKRREMRNLQPLLALRRTPRVVAQGALELTMPSAKGAPVKKVAGFIVQDRVEGSELGDLLKDGDPAVRAAALTEVTALFEELIGARIKLEDDREIEANISIGLAGRGRTPKAWVLDAGEVSVAPPRSALDKLLGRADPLRAYYDKILAGLYRRARI